MTFCEQALILNAENGIDIYGDQGLVQMRGAGLQDLHIRLLPHLQNGASKNDILNAVPSHWVAPVRNYLDQLDRAGVWRQSAADQPTVVYHHHFNLDVMTRHSHSVCILPIDDLSKVLLHLEQLRTIAAVMVFIEPLVGMSVAETMRDHAATFATPFRMLARQVKRGCCYLYRLDLTNGEWLQILKIEDTLRLSLTSRQTEHGFGGHLPLLGATDLPQLPLCSMAWREPFTQRTPVCFGLDPGAVAKTVFYQGLLALVQQGDIPSHQLASLCDVPPTLFSAAANHWYDVVLDLFLQIPTQPKQAWCRRDLATETFEHRELTYLQNILKLTSTDLTVAYALDSEGRHHIQCHGFSCISLCEQASLFRVLMARVVAIYYPENKRLMMQPAEALLMPQAQRRRLARTLLASHQRRMVLGIAKLWGRRIWIGGLADA